MQISIHVTHHEWSENMVIRWGKSGLYAVSGRNLIFGFQIISLLPYEVKCCHDTKHVHLSAFLCIYCKWHVQLLFKNTTLLCII